ncbi:uncharacterized protein LOC128204731 [Mya arenaria]|uniref:uncharacterized protein LOC128204731 n=1 Tax=Mya arenaria TaxID=6604 RepID=UPI0022E82336|nr:uncharacterized protein LOC128204731 [Mya arenaria]
MGLLGTNTFIWGYRASTSIWVTCDNVPETYKVYEIRETETKGFQVDNFTESSNCSLTSATPPGVRTCFRLSKVGELTLTQELDLEGFSVSTTTLQLNVTCISLRYLLNITVVPVNEFKPTFLHAPFAVNVTEVSSCCFPSLYSVSECSCRCYASKREEQ